MIKPVARRAVHRLQECQVTMPDADDNDTRWTIHDSIGSLAFRRNKPIIIILTYRTPQYDVLSPYQKGFQASYKTNLHFSKFPLLMGQVEI